MRRLRFHYTKSETAPGISNINVGVEYRRGLELFGYADKA